MTQLHVDSEVAQPAALPVEVGRIHLVSWRHRGVPQLPAELVRGLPERHVEPGLTRQRGELHPGRPTADDEQAPWTRDRRPRTLDLVAGARVHGAGEAEPLDVAPADALVPADAGTDLGDPALTCLLEDPALGDVRPRHPDDVRVARRQHPLGRVGAVDPAGVDHGDREGGRELAGQGGPLRRVEVGRLDVAGVAPGRADDAVDVVDQAGGLEVLRDLHAPGDVVAAGHLLADVEPDADRESRADLVADRLQGLHGEAACGSPATRRSGRCAGW